MLALGKWLSLRPMRAITYHKSFGEVGVRAAIVDAAVEVSTETEKWTLPMKSSTNCSHPSVSGSATTRVGLIGLTSGRDQAARRGRFWSAQAHGSSSSIFFIGQPLTSLARVSARYA